MFPSFDYGNVVNYLIECSKRDTAEKNIHSEMALGIDIGVLKKTKEYHLTNKQFKEMRSITRKSDELAINVLSIAYDNNKLFILAYKKAKYLQST